MYCISPHLANNYSTTDSLNELIDSIDSKIVEIAIVQLNNARFGLEQKVNLKQYKKLIIYRRILLDKLMGCNCLQDYFLIKIVSKIKKLTK